MAQFNVAKKLIRVALCLSLAAGSTHAARASGTSVDDIEASQPGAKALDLAKAVMAASGNDAEISQVQQMLITPFVADMQRALRNATPEWRSTIEAAVQSELTLERKEMVDFNVKLYATTFSEAELTDMLTFYRSPGGRALVARQPAILRTKEAFGRQLGTAAIKRMIAAVCAKVDCSASSSRAARSMPAPQAGPLVDSSASDQ